MPAKLPRAHASSQPKKREERRSRGAIILYVLAVLVALSMIIGFVLAALVPGAPPAGTMLPPL
jgi:hypothetical protein